MWFGPPECNILHPQERVVLLYVSVLFKDELNLHRVEVVLSYRPPNLFIVHGIGGYIVTQGPTGGPGWLNHYVVGHCQLEVANDVFDGM
jgi:hypothetical protein